MEKEPQIKQGWLRALLFIVFFSVVTLAIGLLIALLPALFNYQQAATQTDVLQTTPLLAAFLVSSTAALITVFAFRTFIDRRSFASLGFKSTGNFAHAATGFFMGILLSGIGTLVLIANKNLVWTGINFNAPQLLMGLGLMLLIAFAEELVFRGYILNNLLQSVSKWIALVLSAIVFAIFHINNPGINPLAITNIFLAGLLLGINYIYTKNLWFGILLHFSWNFLQGPVLGYAVSGLNMPGLLQQELTGPELLTGGSFGFEASLLEAILSIVTIIILALVYEKKIAAKTL